MCVWGGGVNERQQYSIRDVLVQWSEDEFPLSYAGMRYNEVSSEVVQRGPLRSRPGVKALRVIREDINVDGARAVSEGGDTPDSCLDLLDKRE